MYFKKINEVYQELKTSEKGLTSRDAKDRIVRYGLNEIKAKKPISPIKIFLSQFANFIIYILFGAMIISFILGEKIDVIVIGAILVLNAVMGFVQEYKAEKAIEALKKMASLKARVIRDGREQHIDSMQLVPGDVIVLETGDKVPADCRLSESINLQTQESALTGESTPVKKIETTVKENTPVADRVNMAFSGTVVTNGRGTAIVVSTGMQSEIGKIAKMIQSTTKVMTPLQKSLEQLGKFLAIGVIIIAIIVFIAGVLMGGMSMLDMLLTAVALAVAAIPEGLPAVVTISLALGVQRMIKRNALVRKLPSVETLGSTTVICSDKTGTLTCNEMTVKKLFVNDKVIEVTGRGYKPEGSFQIDKKNIDPKDFSLLLQIGTLCNDARLSDKDMIGDPTEISLIVSAEKAGIKKHVLERRYPRKGEIQFTSERKIMSTLHNIDNKKLIYTKGAPDIVLDLCDRIIINGKVQKLSKEQKKKILEKNNKFADSALRVLGFAYGDNDQKEENLIFVGLQAMMDPARPEVKGAIDKCKDAGIRVVMITGDHIVTAKAIARELGIEGKAVEGKDIHKINLDKEVDNIAVYARVNPEHKTEIVDALRKKGHIIAMTGDGVNDAPALKNADIGIAMGITGTDVSKEASDMILTDDNFASIVNSVEEGRGIYDNIKKFFAFLISGNIGEVMIIFLAIMLGLPLPLTAIQILLINLVTDGLPAVALGADPFEPNAMKRKPRGKKEPIYKNLNHFIVYYPIIMIVTVLGLFYYIYTTSGNLMKAQTITFLSIAMFEMYQAFASRSTRYSAFKVGIFKNKFLVGAVIISLLVSIAVIYVPFLQSLFNTFPITLMEFIIVAVVSSLGFIYLELYKILKGDRLKT